MPPLHIIDAFTEKPFKGNPAAVCLLAAPRDPAWMQSLAAEMNLSETAFLLPQSGGELFNLRWFTPQCEVDLCGHATLAKHHFLWETHTLPADRPATFSTRSGPLTCNLRGSWIEMDFPAEPPTDTPDSPDLLAALHPSSRILSLQRNRFDYMVELEREESLLSLKPDFARLASLPVRGIIVTTRSSNPQFDFLSRFFAPAVGINEDPVTGSAHCALAPYWHKKLGKSQLTAYQASPRGGILKITLPPAPSNRVLLAGQATTILRGQVA